jgi:diguanylate cyclase (GGDEF)-like protein
VYPFSLTEGENDSCIVIEFDSNTLLKMLELTIAINGSRWAVVSGNNSILYHSRGYNEAMFSEMNGFLEKYNDCTIINNLSGDKLIVHFSNVEGIDNMRLLYIVPAQSILQTSKLNIIVVIVVTVISIILLSFFVLLVTRKIVKEINAIRHSLKGISNRDYTESIKIRTNDEIGQLAEEFNEAIDELRYQAEHDSKTDFYNASAFAKKARNRMITEPEKKYAVVRVDIDNFSFVNDIFDWDVGDEILRKIASILRKSFGEEAIYGYLGNDIFVVHTSYDEEDDILSDIIRSSDAIKVCEPRINIVPHFGVVEKIAIDSDVIVMCDYAGVALKTVKGNFF